MIGVGRKMFLKHYSTEYYYDTSSYDWIEEGQFADDKLEGYGRRYFMNKSINYKIGYFMAGS